MKLLKSILLGTLVIIVLIVSSLYIFGYGYILRGIGITYFHGHYTAYIADYPYFDNRKLPKSTHPQPWATAKDYNSVPTTKRLDSVKDAIGTVAFLIIKNDSIWHESYYDGYTKDSKSNSFSMAKSIVVSALGKAIKDGKIESLDTKVGSYFPEFSTGKAAKLTIGDLASMASGLDWDEKYYSPFSITTRAYFDRDLPKTMLSLKIVDEPGTFYKYASGNTELLAMILQKATGQELSSYVSENFWQPLGAENEALWQTDKKDGIVKAYCCFASNARDFARFGKLYKQHGKWNGKQLIDSSFVETCTTPRFADSPFYGYGWWIFDHNGKIGYYMRGHLGQYVIVIPKDNLIIVRLGESGNRNDEGEHHSNDFYVYLEETYKMLSQRK
jgi:CubicO group peptidase (beta-lactamase class C family)